MSYPKFGRIMLAVGTTRFCWLWVAAVAGLWLAPAVTLGAEELRPRLSVMHLTGSGLAKSDLRALEPVLAFELARRAASWGSESSCL